MSSNTNNSTNGNNSRNSGPQLPFSIPAGLMGLQLPSSNGPQLTFPNLNNPNTNSQQLTNPLQTNSLQNMNINMMQRLYMNTMMNTFQQQIQQQIQPSTQQSTQQIQQNPNIKKPFTTSITFTRGEEPNPGYEHIFNALDKTPGLKGFQTIDVTFVKHGNVDIGKCENTDDESQPQKKKQNNQPTESQIEETLKWVYMNDKTNRTTCAREIHVSEVKQLDVYKILKDAKLLTKPGTTKYYINKNVYKGEKVEHDGKLIPVELDVDFDIKNELIKDIYGKVAIRVNKEKANHIRNLEKKRKEKIELKKETRKRKNQSHEKQEKKEVDKSAEPPPKKQRLNNNDSNNNSTINDSS
eukprot:57218_1